MTGLPTLTVKLDDGTGTYPYDVSAFVRLPDGVSVTRGRQDELDDVSPSSLSLTFDNTTGVFTLGSVTYGIAIDQPIQVSLNAGAGAVKVFTGYVQDWPVAWPDGSDQFAVAQVTAVDRLSRLVRRKLRAALEYEILADTPQWYWPCTEAAGSVTAGVAGDISGNLGPSLVPTGAGAPPTFADAALGIDGASAPTMTNGQYLGPERTLTLGSSATSWTYEFAFSTSDLTSDNPLAYVGISAANQIYLSNTTGYLTFNLVAQGSVNYADGLPHHVAVTFSAGTWTVYVDGASVLTAAVADSGGTTPTFRLGDAGTLSGYIGTIGQAAFHTSVLSSARILTHANALLNGFATDTADQRIARLASYANIATADQNLEAGQQPSIAGQGIVGSNVLDAMQTVMAAEGGLVFISGDGKLVMQSKGHRVVKATGSAALALTADQIDPSVSPGGAKAYLFNTATGQRDGGAQQRSTNASSVTAYEEYPTSLDRALLPSDSLVLDLLQWTTTKYGTPLPRFGSLTIDLLTTASSTTVQNALALELGDLVTLSGLPSQTPASLGNLLVEGSSMSLTHDSWSLTLNTVPSSIFLGPIVDQASATCDTGYPVYF